MCIGVSGSGKSFYSERFREANPKTIILNPDQFRAIYGKDESDQTVNYQVFSNVSKFTEYLLINDYDVFIDATNYSIKNRKTFVNLAKKHEVFIKAIILDVSLDVCYDRNSKRSRVVPNDVIKRQFDNLVIPTKEELGENSSITVLENH